VLHQYVSTNGGLPSLDFCVAYELNVYTDRPNDRINICSELHRNIQDAFNEYGLQIRSPHYLADRPQPTVVPKDKWYAPPAQHSAGSGQE
jgi:hypothetical protein